MTTIHRFIRHSTRFCSLAALAIGLFVITPAHAQFIAQKDFDDRLEPIHLPVSSTLTMSPTWKAHAIQQFTAALASPVALIRQQTLQNIIVLTMLHGDVVDLRDTAPALLDVYQFDANENLRIMALSALMTVGETRSIQRLRELVPDVHSERLRRHTLLALAQHDAQSSQ